MRPSGHTDQVLGVDYVVIEVNDVIESDRVHVMHEDGTVNMVTFDSEVASVVSDDHLVSYGSPFSAGVELLIEMPVIAEGYFAYDSV